jgi:hypothetical protein
MRSTPTRPSGAWLAGTVVFLALFWFTDLAILRAGAPDPLDDSWEYGTVARSLLTGHGFRTSVIHPPLWALRDTANTVPVLVHGPLMPMVLAPFVVVFGSRLLDHVAWLAALFAGLAAVSLFRLGERARNSATGTAAALALTLSPLMLRAVHHDIALPAGAFLLAFSLDHLTRKRPHIRRAALAMGAGMLVRPEFLLALPLLAVLAGKERRRFLLIALAPLLPWAWHGWVNAGSPLFNLSSYLIIGYWGSHPEISVMRDFALPPRAWPQALAQALPELPGKWLDFLPHALKRVIYSPSPFTGWLTPLGTLLALQSPGSRPLTLVSVGLAMLPLGIMTVTLFDERYVVPFLPVFALAVARAVSESVDWLPSWVRPPRVWIGVLVALLAITALPALYSGWREGDAARERLGVERAALAALPPEVPGAGPVYSDTPDFVAWTLQRPALWVTLAEYEALAGEKDPGDAPADRPRRGPGDVTWFHAADGRGAAYTAPTLPTPRRSR